MHFNPTAPFRSAEALCRYFEKHQTLWAVVFYSLPPDPHTVVPQARAIVGGSQARIVPLLQPWSPAPFMVGKFVQGKYTEEVLRSYLRPQGFLSGVGEIPIYETELQPVTFQSPQMQTVFRSVNAMKGIVMIHPSGDHSGRKMDLAEIEPAIRDYSDVIFLFHGTVIAFDLVSPLMSKYPNVYFSADATTWIFFGPWQPSFLTFPEGKGTGSSERFLADVNRVGVQKILEESLRQALPRLRQYPDRIMWGTDRGIPWHFEDSATEVIITVSRRFIARLPEDLQEKYAFRNALRIFGPYLSPSP